MNIPCKDTVHRRDLGRILGAVVDAIDPGALVCRYLHREEEALIVGGREVGLEEVGEIFVLGLGKASVPMARAVEAVLGERLGGGVVVCREGDVDGDGGLRRIEVVEGSHPVPDESSAEAAGRLLDAASRAGPEDFVICLVSGGGSALTTLAAPGMTTGDLRKTNEVLLESGASIAEVNAVRKHLSAFSGGRLARAIHPASHSTLILSDVIDGGVDVVASGPTVADTTTFGDALDVVERYELAQGLPDAVVEHLRRGDAGEVEETPGADAPCVAGASSFVIGDVGLATDAACNSAGELGWNTAVITTFLEGEARHAARFVESIAREVAVCGRPVAPPACLVFGGETTVTVTGDGKGGRNQEFALAALSALCEEVPVPITIASFATDGVDGPTDAAGAIVDVDTRRRARQLGLDPGAYLAANDAYEFFRQTGDLIVTGPTQSNVNDVVVVLVG